MVQNPSAIIILMLHRNTKNPDGGKWLEALGFHIGDATQVAYEEGSIHISLAPQTQSEPTMVCDTKARYASK